MKILTQVKIEYEYEGNQCITIMGKAIIEKDVSMSTGSRKKIVPAGTQVRYAIDQSAGRRFITLIYDEGSDRYKKIQQI